MEGGNNRFIVTDKHLQDLEDYASDNGSGASSAVIPYYANQNENGKKSIVPYDGGSAGGSVTYSNYSYGDGTSIVPYSVANSSVNPAEYNNYSLSNVDIEGAEEAQMPTEEIVPFENRKKETQPSRKRSHKPRKPMQKCFPQIILALFTLFFVAVIGLGVALYVFNDLEDSKVQEGVDNDIESTKPPVVTITDPPVELPVDTTTTYPTAGTPEPTAKPTSAPTMPPVTGNTTDSTMESNENATSTSTSVPVTPGPTKSPHEDNNEDNKIPLATFLTTEFGVDFTDPYSPAYLAHQWISMQDIDGLSNDQLAQRFALVALDYSLLRNFDSMQVSNWVSSESHECSWEGVTCASNIVTGVRLHSMDLPGMIPSEIGILKNLTSLDLAENQLFGTIPEALYKLTQLNEIYLYKNKLTGTISPSIGNLTALAKLHLSHNNLSGSIPETMRSDPDIKPYRKCFII